MPQIVDTTIRLLSQDPLAGKLPTGEVLRIAEILDTAGFSYLEVSGGGVFDAAVRRAVESPWERIRAIDARTTTPLGLALRGRFLVGSRPVSADIVRRFVSCAADNGIDVFRLHDPLNDVSNLIEAGEAIVAAGKEFHVGLVYSAGRTGEIDALVERAKQIPALGATRVIINDPTDALLPHLTEELVERIREETGLPVGLFVQGAAGTGLLNAVVATRVGGDLIATAVYPLALTLHRVSGESLVEALHGLGRDTGVKTAPLWEAADLVDEHIGDEPVAPVAPRIAVRAAEYDLPAGLVAALDVHLRAHAAGDRLLDTLTEVVRIRVAAARGADRPDPGVPGAPQHPLRASLRHRARRVPDARGGRLRRHPGADRGVRHAGGRARRRKWRWPRRRPAECRGRARGGRGSRGERGGPRSARDVRSRGRNPAAVDPPAPLARDLAAPR
jgi:pyruvate/oxaloacetate carboxyltransferase